MQQRDADARLRHVQQQEDDQAGYPHLLLPGEGQRDQGPRGEQPVQAGPGVEVESLGTAPPAPPPQQHHLTSLSRAGQRRGSHRNQRRAAHPPAAIQAASTSTGTAAAPKVAARPR